VNVITPTVHEDATQANCRVTNKSAVLLVAQKSPRTMCDSANQKRISIQLISYAPFGVQ